MIKILSVTDAMKYKNTLSKFIYESKMNSVYRTTYTKEEANLKSSELIEYLKKDKALLIGAIERDELIGMLWAYYYPYREDLNRIYVSILHVDEKNRSKGLGSLLIKKIEEYAYVNGVSSIFLHTDAVNKGAMHFYEANGFSLERVQLKKVIKGEIQ